MVSLLRSLIYIQHQLGMEDQKQMEKEEEEWRWQLKDHEGIC